MSYVNFSSIIISYGWEAIRDSAAFFQEDYYEANRTCGGL